VKELNKRLRTKTFGRKLTYREVADSTNELAIRAARTGAVEGSVFVADHQTCGRGRMGRRWLAPPGTCVLCSVLFRPDSRVAHVGWLTMVTSLAAADAIRQVAGLRVVLKWPNDLVVGRGGTTAAPAKWKKLAGVLTETGLKGSQVEYAIVGIGINVNVELSQLSGLSPDATSILAETGRAVDRGELLAEMINTIEDRYERLRAGEPPVSEWSARLATLGREVVAATSTYTLRGLADSVEETGALLLRSRDGTMHRLWAADVTLIEA
jgi:BirA family biotin operon repressor/biotin-[acetyl-CoA-carboxylase] ligase